MVDNKQKQWGAIESIHDILGITKFSICHLFYHCGQEAVSSNRNSAQDILGTKISIQLPFCQCGKGHRNHAQDILHLLSQQLNKHSNGIAFWPIKGLHVTDHQLQRLCKPTSFGEFKYKGIKMWLAYQRLLILTNLITGKITANS